MKAKVFLLQLFIVLGETLFAQNYYLQYAHDTLGNRTGRVRGILTREMESDGLSADTSLQVIIPITDTAPAPKEETAEEADPFKHGRLIKTKAEKVEYLRKMMARTAAIKPIKDDGEPPRDVSNYDVGSIPLQYGVSPMGGRTYSIPIQTSPDIKYTPSIALAYNSQGGYGYGGYGWDLSGVSAIRLVGKNLYYDGETTAPSSVDTAAVFALDGNRLVRNEDPVTSSDFPLVTAQGHILAAANKNAAGYVTSFTVKSPDGVTATYGLNVNTPACNYPAYPILSSVNLNGDRIEYKYTVDSTDGNYTLYRIEYGFDSQSTAKGRLQFTTSSSSSYSYYAGKKVMRSPRLTKIESSSDGNTLFTYTPSYATSEGAWLLRSVSLKNADGDDLSPLSFTYGYAEIPKVIDSIHKTKTLQLPEDLDPGPMPCTYKRGKFVKGSYNDGLLQVIASTLYQQTGNRIFEYCYPGNYPIAFCPSIEEIDTATYVLSEAAFMGVEAVDVDGDGVDDVVKVNCGATDGSGSTLSIKVYKSNSDGGLYAVDSLAVNVAGSISGFSTYSPYLRTFRWGDFLGNGKAQLLAVSYSDNGLSCSQWTVYTLIDLSSHTVLFEEICDPGTSVLPPIASGDDNLLTSMDIDGDSVTELCVATTTGLKSFHFRNGTFNLEKTYSNLTDSVVADDDTYFLDINADGYIDVVTHPDATTTWTAYLNTGLAFTPTTLIMGDKVNGDVYFFMDVNRDGYPDALRARNDTLWYYRNADGLHFDAISEPSRCIDNTIGILPANVIDYSSMSSFIKIEGAEIHEYGFLSYTPERRQLVQSKDSYGAVVRSAYNYLPLSSLDWTDNPGGISAADGFQLKALPIYVLRSSVGFLSDSANSQVFLQDTYAWYDGVVNTRGLGFCGFSKTSAATTLDVIPVTTETCFDPQRMGVQTSQKSYFYFNWDNPFSSASLTWDNHSTTYGKLSPRLTQSVSTDNTTGIITTTSYTYDSLDYPTRIITSSKIGTSGTARISIEDKTYSHSNTASNYVLGTVASQRVLTDRDGNPMNMLGEHSVFTYDTCYRPLTRNDYKVKTLGNPLSPNYQQYLVSKSRWTYDSHGNVLTEESAPYDATEYTGNTYTYDSSGRHLTSSTNALGQTTTYSNFDRYGNARTITDHRNRVRTNSFDSWGKQTKTVYADGTVDSTAIAWNGQGVYTVTRTVTGKPSTIVHYDALSREIRSGNRRFNGQWQYTDTEYNQRGMVYRSSLPFRGTSASYWNTSTYDSYGRRTKITEASGRMTQWSYSGTSVTQTKDGIAVTRTTNALGDLVSVTDAAGTVTYVLRDDGQPSSVTAPGSVTTSFTYDNYGRRTSIVDPSAGTRSTAYTVNADGSSVTTETNALGSIATSADKYGRVTGVTRTGTGAFNTTYTYDTYGRLSAVSSTNSTGEEYTYDAYDRVATVTETVPDGKWLQKSYTYGSGSNVASIAYTSQSGYITTENYSYSNGHNNVIVIAGGTTVLAKTGENDLGQPTAATSGSVSRTYEYTAYGFPTKRKLTAGGNTIQDLRTTFNPQTGNLTNRSNAANSSSTEYFYYDALGRLNYDSQGPSSYDVKGNAIYRSGVGTMTYPNAAHPYQIDRLNASSASVTSQYSQTVTYTAYDRPATINEWMPTATFTYNAEYRRAKMQTGVQGSVVQKKYYIGDRYEREEASSSITERLFVGGDAYSAPMVLQRTGGTGSWTAYVIGRDYLGSITDITTTSGTSVATYSYDAWGRLRNPQTLSPYAYNSQPSLLLGRGYCGHEHLSNYGLINMNARLYDPVLGRFLSPDPYVQSPDFSQNFNRYAYALNNPFKYTDSSGQFFILDSFLIGWIGGDLDRAKQMAWNDLKIWGGLFNVDKNKGFWGGTWELISRFTWQLPQTAYGFIFAQSMNTFHLAGGVDSVEYLHGATVLKGHKNGWGAVTIGSYIMGDCDIEAKDDNGIFQHEFGHYLQSQDVGLLWASVYGFPSLRSASKHDGKHKYYYTEQDANARSFRYFAKHYSSYYAEHIWKFDKNPITGYIKTKDYYNSSNLEALNNAILLSIIPYKEYIYKENRHEGSSQLPEDTSINTMSNGLAKDYENYIF